MRIKLLSAVAAGLLLQACQPPEPPTELIQPVLGACTEGEIASLVGQHVDTLKGVTINAPLRLIHEGEAVTMDYNAERINIVVDENDMILEAYCG